MPSSDTPSAEKEQQWDAFLAGFLESAEGWNGEYPYYRDPDKVEKRLRSLFEEWYEND